MVVPKLPKPFSKKFTAYRNIYTIKDSEEIYDDIVDPEDYGIIYAWDQKASGIDHDQPKARRVFQYGDLGETLGVFDRINWKYGRFGDGEDYGVWYGALEEETSIREACYWRYQLIKNDLMYAKGPISTDRKMFEASCFTKKGIDLRKIVNKYPKIIDKKDYSFCHTLGQYAVSNRIELYFSLSVREPNGTCVPIFAPNVIQEDQVLYFLHFTFFQNGKMQITRDRDFFEDIPPGW